MTDRLSTETGSVAPPAAAAKAPAVAPARRKPRVLPTIALSLATFAVLFEFLAFQLSAGNDPALGSTATEIASTKAPRPVIHRKLIKTRVVHLPPKPASESSGAPVSTGSVSSSVPSPSPAAAPSAAPAPAPAPAPVTASS